MVCNTCCSAMSRTHIAQKVPHDCMQRSTYISHCLFFSLSYSYSAQYVYRTIRINDFRFTRTSEKKCTQQNLNWKLKENMFVSRYHTQTDRDRAFRVWEREAKKANRMYFNFKLSVDQWMQTNILKICLILWLELWLCETHNVLTDWRSVLYVRPSIHYTYDDKHLELTHTHALQTAGTNVPRIYCLSDHKM